MPSLNRQVRVVTRPTGIPQAEHFKIVQEPGPAVGEGQILVHNHFVSVDPAMRGWLADVANYAVNSKGHASGAIQIGGVMRAMAVGEISGSRHPRYRPGDFVTGWFGWQDYCATDPRAVVQRVPPTELPLSLWLGVLGLNGVTAYLGLSILGNLQAGQTVIVSTAAGSVGATVGQLAKLQGCRTVGIAGGPVKTRLCVEEFGYDAAIDYKADNFAAALAEAVPEGANLYFDNTAGIISDALRNHMAIGGRIIICGTASVANWDPTPIGPRSERYILTRRLTVCGFIAFDHADQWGEAVENLLPLVRQGKLRYREEILDGIEQAPDAVAGLYRGENLGKRVIRL